MLLDRLKKLKSKMQEYIKNGVQLGWLIDSSQQKTYIYRADGSEKVKDGLDKILSGENVLLGFELKLNLLKK